MNLGDTPSKQMCSTKVPSQNLKIPNAASCQGTVVNVVCLALYLFSTRKILLVDCKCSSNTGLLKQQQI